MLLNIPNISWVNLAMMLRYHILKLLNYTCYKSMIIAYYFSYWRRGPLFHSIINWNWNWNENSTTNKTHDCVLLLIPSLSNQNSWSSFESPIPIYLDKVLQFKRMTLWITNMISTVVLNQLSIKRFSCLVSLVFMTCESIDPHGSSR